MKRFAAITFSTGLAIAGATACVPPSPPALTAWAPGVYFVGSDPATDIEPGLYMSIADGQLDTAFRFDGNGNDLSGVTADRILVEVLPTDTGVEVTEGRLVRWQPTTISPNAPVDGLFFAGTEWGAGTYTISTHPDGRAFWSKSNDVNGDQVYDQAFSDNGTLIPPLVVEGPPPTGPRVVEVHGIWTQ